METGEIHRKQMKRRALLEFFANRQPGIVAMKACGSAHYWGRELRKLGHEVRLVAAQFVRPFVKTNKNDAADVAAIWETVQRPDMRFVAVKSEEQQSILSLHRIREQLIKVRTMQVNQIRGLLYCRRWVSPNGTVSYGDQPPPSAAKLQSLPPIPPPPPPVAHLQTPQKAATVTPSSAASDKTLTAIERLNLLVALNNYQNSLRPPPEPEHHVYIPAYIGPAPFPPYRPGHPPHWRRPPPRPIRPPSNRPPTVLLSPPAPASANPSPVLLP